MCVGVCTDIRVSEFKCLVGTFCIGDKKNYKFSVNCTLEWFPSRNYIEIRMQTMVALYILEQTWTVSFPVTKFIHMSTSRVYRLRAL